MLVCQRNVDYFVNENNNQVAYQSSTYTKQTIFRFNVILYANHQNIFRLIGNSNLAQSNVKHAFKIHRTVIIYTIVLCKLSTKYV